MPNSYVLFLAMTIIFVDAGTYNSQTNYLHQIYPSELEIKETTDTPALASYLDLYLYIDNAGRLKSKLYDKHDDFDFPIVNFPFLSSNMR
jgi:hypothetical protein